MKLIKTKFASTCGCGCGQNIPKGINVLYDGKNVYVQGHEPDPAAQAIQDNENAFFDDFCSHNNI